jgi:hypothetical protein
MHLSKRGIMSPTARTVTCQPDSYYSSEGANLQQKMLLFETKWHKGECKADDCVEDVRGQHVERLACMCYRKMKSQISLQLSL